MYIDRKSVADLQAALAAASTDEGSAAAVVAAARRALETANADDFDHLVARIGAMGEALRDEDGSNEREHDTAYAVFEAAQALAPELAPKDTTAARCTSCGWCGEAIPPDTDYYEARGRQCCEQCRAAADRHGTPYSVKRSGRETNFTDTVTLYERVDRDGEGEGIYLSVENAWRKTEPGEKVAEAVYTLTDHVELVRPGGPRH